MSRATVLVCLLVILIVTSQFEWKPQPLVTEIEALPNFSKKQLVNLKREDVVKEKIILSQEKQIQKLNEHVQSIEQQLRECQLTKSKMVNISSNSLKEIVDENERRNLG